MTLMKLRGCRGESGHVTCWDARHAARELGTLRCGEEPILSTSTQSHCVSLAHASAREGAVDRSLPACQAEDRPSDGGDMRDANEPAVSTTGTEHGVGGTAGVAIVAGSAGAHLTWLRLDTSGRISISRKDELPEEGVGDVCVRQDGRIVAVGCWDARARLFHMRSGKRLAVLKQHRASITAVQFGDSGLLACASRDKTVSLWDLYR